MGKWIQREEGSLTFRGPAVILIVPIWLVIMAAGAFFYTLAGAALLVGAIGTLGVRAYNLGKRGESSAHEGNSQ